MIGIYKITNTENGKSYIGKSKSILNRWKQHIKELEENRHHTIRLQYDYNKYGVTKFEFKVLELCEEKELVKLENKYILKFFSDFGDLYNTQITNEPKEVKTNNKIITPKNLIKIPLGITYNFNSVNAERIMIYSLMKLCREKLNHLEFSVKEFEEEGRLRGNSIYDRLESYKLDLIKTKVNGVRLFDKITIKGGLLIVDINKDIAESIIKNKKCLSIKLGLKDVVNFNMSKTFKTLYLAMSKMRRITVEEYKDIIGLETSSYCNYSELKRNVLSRAIEDLAKVGIKLIVKENRKGRSVDNIELSIENIKKWR